MFVSATSSIVLYVYNFVFFFKIILFVIFALWRLINKAYLCFRLVGANGKQQITPTTNNYVFEKNVLRTFDAEILKIFKSFKLSLRSGCCLKLNPDNSNPR